MFYIVSTEGQIVESLYHCPTLEELRELAEECECGLWVIRGEHIGIEVTQPIDDTAETELPPERRFHQYEDYAVAAKPPTCDNQRQR